MIISNIVKREYFGKIIIFHLDELSHIEYEEDVARLSFKNKQNIIVNKNALDHNNDLKKITLDLYSSWKKYSENLQMLVHITEE